jgi:hypothetical protein
MSVTWNARLLEGVLRKIFEKETTLFFSEVNKNSAEGFNFFTWPACISCSERKDPSLFERGCYLGVLE